MKKVLHTLSVCLRAMGKRKLVGLAACAAGLAVAASVVLVSGCASTPAGLNREQALYQAGTNVVATIREVVPYLPGPAGTGVEAILGLATAALAAWNTHQHVQIKQLKNGNGKAAPAPNPATGPPADPSA